MNDVVTEFELQLREGPSGVDVRFYVPGAHLGTAAYEQLVGVVDDFVAGFGRMPSTSTRPRVPAKVVGHVTEGGGVGIRVMRFGPNDPVPPLDLFGGYLDEVGHYFHKLRADLNR